MDNAKTITDAFSRLSAVKDICARNALVKALEYAMEWALLSHDEEHQQHIALGDNYGWAVVHDNEIVDMDIKAPHGEDGDAERQLRGIVQSSKRKGWYGILMAGMTGAVTYYSVDYETAILYSTINSTGSVFNDFFKNKMTV